MSDNLDNYMESHRGDFDFLEPDTALWNKIENRLGKSPKRRNLSILWKAAAIIIIFGFSFWAQMQIEDKPHAIHKRSIQNTSNTLAQVDENETTPVKAINTESRLIPEFAETEKYYSRKVNSTMKELKVYLVKYPEVAADMKKDIAELDSVYKSLKRDLGDDVAHEEIISAMIQNYRMKLQILEDIKSELIQNSTPKPNKNNDTTVY